jgi:PAP2 superfamily
LLLVMPTPARPRHGGSFACVLLLGVAACVGPDAQGRGERHFSPRVWSNAFDEHLAQPGYLAAELGLLVATPILGREDARIQEEAARDQSVTRANTARGDAMAYGLGVAVAGIAGLNLARGDDFESLEVAGESMLVTEGITEVLKETVRRPRPEGGRTSFPSGHASFAFSAATYLARSVYDLGDGPYRYLGFLAYAPAGWIAVNRVEASRHWPSDVAFGAVLGMVTTNLFYNAHYGDAGHAGIYTGGKPLAWQVEPYVAPDGAGVSLVYRF